MAQQTHGIHGALPNQHDEIDAANRAAFEENFRIVKKCWTEEMLTFDGKYWKIPAGPTPWTLDTTAKWGKGVEDGILTAVGVVPKPLQKPHPPLFQPFASSENTIRFCAQEDITPILPPMHPVHEDKLYSVYAEVSGKPKGRGIGVLRDVIIADTDEEAMALWRDSGQFSGRAWFEPFGFRKGLQDPVTGKFPTPEEIVAKGYAYVGTVDTVLRAMETPQTAPAGRLDVLLHLQRPGAARGPDALDRGLLDQGDAALRVSRRLSSPVLRGRVGRGKATKAICEIADRMI